GGVEAGLDHGLVDAGQPGREAAQAEDGRVGWAGLDGVVADAEQQAGGRGDGVPGRLVDPDAGDGALGGHGDAQPGGVGEAGRVPGGRDGQADRRVRYGGGEDAVLGEAEPVAAGELGRYHAAAGLDADQSTTRGGDPYRAEAVVAVRDRDQAGGHG